MLTTYKTLCHISGMHTLYNHALPLKYLTLLASSGKRAAVSGSHAKIPTGRD